MKSLRPSSQDVEEEQGPRKIGPLVERYAYGDGGGGGLRAQRPIPRRNGGDRHPVHGRISSDAGCGQLADKRREGAANQAKIDRRPPSAQQGRCGSEAGGFPFKR
jgi:hypothetical protein